MTSFASYWGMVLGRAWRETWRVVVRHNVGTAIRDALLLALTFGLLFVLKGWLVSHGEMSADNVQDTIVWIILSLLALVAVFALVFLVQVLFLGPYNIWRETNAQLPKPVLPKPLPVPAPPPPKLPLTPHEAERKIKVIDAGLDLLAEMRVVIGKGRKLHGEEWFLDTDRARRYPDEIQVLITAFAVDTRGHAFQVEHAEYHDIDEALRAITINAHMNELAIYMNACRSLATLIAAGAPYAPIMDLYSPYRNRFKDTLNGIESGHNIARGGLTDLRLEVASV